MRTSFYCCQNQSSLCGVCLGGVFSWRGGTDFSVTVCILNRACSTGQLRKPLADEFQNSHYLLSCSEVSLFPHKHTQQLNRTCTLWALQEAMQRLSCMRKGWGKAGNSSLTVLCSQLHCSLPNTSSSEELQCSCLVFLNPCFRGLYKSSFIPLLSLHFFSMSHMWHLAFCDVVSVKIVFLNAVILLSWLPAEPHLCSETDCVFLLQGPKSIWVTLRKWGTSLSWGSSNSFNNCL